MEDSEGFCLDSAIEGIEIGQERIAWNHLKI
jgi:hypothetical protein